MIKKCSKCKINKNINEFYKDSRAKNGLSSWCKSCSKEYKKINIRKIIKYRGKYYKENKDFVLKQQKEHEKTISRKESKKRYKQKRLNTDPLFKLIGNIRNRVNLVLRKTSKVDKTINLLGCSIQFLKYHLESQFNEGMTWNNHGIHGWHIDHIIPCAAFDLRKPEEQRKCFHYSNLQPLWAIDNLKKSNS